MTTFRQLLEFFEESAKTQAAKGRRFEDFCAAFLRIDRTWSEEFDEVWTWQEWPGRPPGHPDTGIDLVAQRRGSGDLVAIQCKFYKPSAVLGWEHISTFVAMLSQDVFASGMVISTAGAESANLHKNIAVSPKPVVWWRVDDFEDSLVDWNAFRPSEPTRLALGDVKTVRDYQRQAIDDVVSGLSERRPWPVGDGVRHGQDVHVATARRATRRQRRLSAVPRAIDQPVVADRDRMGERRTGTAGDLRGVLRHSRRPPRATRTCPRTISRFPLPPTSTD